MPRFPVAFGKRKSTADTLDNAQAAGPSFRVLDRSEIGTGKQTGFDGGARLANRNSQHLAPRTSVVPDTSSLEDNIFADLKTNRGSGSSNTTKTTSTDNSSRHSNASTAPSSADMNTNANQEDWRNNARKPSYDHIPLPPVPKDRSSGFLKAAGRSFSFGGKNKTSQPATLVEEPSQMEPMPPSPPQHDDYSGRPRATTSSTVSTAMPPKVDQDFTLDLGGDFSRMLLGGDKRQSVATLRDEPNRQAPRSLTGGPSQQPSPLHLDQTSKVEPSPFSWGSRHSDDHLLNASPIGSPVAPPVPKHGSPLASRSQINTSPLDKKQKKNSGFFGRKSATPEEPDVEEEDARLLKESLSSVNKFLAGNAAPESQNPGRYRRNEEVPSSGYRQVSSESRVSRLDKMEDDNLFSTSLAHSSRLAQRYVARKPSPPRNKVMTPAQFERYRKDKERQDSTSEPTKPEVKDDDDDEDHYEDDDDEVEKSKQAAKQRRKQEAHMTVYRQQMMKVTGEQSSHTFAGHPHIPMSISSPNLGAMGNNGPSPTGGDSPEDEDEEVPLAILAAHGFPSKNRPPTRLSTMMSNPNLQAAAAPSYQRPMSVAGDAPTGPGGRLPAFAKNLPQDPYLGAGLIHQAPRESFALGGGAPASASGGVPPGGLVGVIASEERSRAMRRGSPAIDAHRPLPNMGGPQQFDPMGGIPPQMMYPSMPGQQMPGMMTPQDQAQMQMNQQMQQFMQMQMQFMQMMATNSQGGQQRPGSQHAAQSMGMMGPGGMGMMGGMPGMPGMGTGNPDMMRRSFVDNGSVMDLPMPPRPDHTRTMSLVQPSSASWIQPPLQMPAGYAPSIRIQGINGGAYAPSIAPSERSNIGLPGRYRPVSQMPGAMDPQLHMRKASTMSGALGAAGWDQTRKSSSKSPSSPLGSVGGQPPKKVAEEEEDDNEAWEKMKEKREKKRGLWKSKKGFGADLAALIS